MIKKNILVKKTNAKIGMLLHEKCHPINYGGTYLPAKSAKQGSKAELLQPNHTQFICRINSTNKKVGNRKN